MSTVELAWELGKGWILRFCGGKSGSLYFHRRILVITEYCLPRAGIVTLGRSGTALCRQFAFPRGVCKALRNLLLGRVRTGYNRMREVVFLRRTYISIYIYMLLYTYISPEICNYMFILVVPLCMTFCPTGTGSPLADPYGSVLYPVTLTFLSPERAPFLLLGLLRSPSTPFFFFPQYLSIHITYPISPAGSFSQLARSHSFCGGPKFMA